MSFWERASLTSFVVLIFLGLGIFWFIGNVIVHDVAGLTKVGMPFTLLLLAISVMLAIDLGSMTPQWITKKLPSGKTKRYLVGPSITKAGKGYIFALMAITLIVGFVLLPHFIPTVYPVEELSVAIMSVVGGP